MSGDRVQLLDEGGSVVRLVKALGAVVADASGPAALIGGLAVLARASGAYRVTNDVDAVAEPDTLGLVLAARGTPVGASWTVDGVKIDLVEVGTTPAAQLSVSGLPDDEADRLFVLAHQWALDIATEMEIAVCDERTRPLAVAARRVATPAALVAMKVQSAPRRSAAGRYKTASDYADVHRLLTRPGLLVQTAVALARAPHALGDWVAAELERRFVGDAERVAGVIRTNLTLAAGAAITPDDLHETGHRFLAAFRHTERDDG